MKSFFAIVGIIMMIAEIANEVFNSQFFFNFYRDHCGWLFFSLTIISIACNFERLSYTVKIADSSDVSITIKVCDVLNNKGAAIIPTNTTFDTILENDFISKKSVQGQYQLRYFKDEREYLDKQICDGLNNITYIILKDGRKSKVKRYPIGTVCKITKMKKRVYFLADSDINPFGIPINTDPSNIAVALVKLWDYLAIIGNQEEYSIPLLGSGKARYKNASREEIIREIILTFISATKSHKITESLIICIHPSDYEKINWDSICYFLKYNCTYANLKPEQKVPDGTAETNL